MNFYKRHLGDYAKDAGHLSMLEHGAYTLLLDRYYTTEQPIPKVDVYRVTRARLRDEVAATDAVLREFFRLDGDAYRSKRADQEIEKASRQRAINQETGRRGGRPKKETDSEPNGNRIGLQTEPNNNPSQTPDSKEQEQKPSRGQAAPAPDDQVPKAKGCTFGTFVKECRARDEKLIPEDHPVFRFAEDAGIPVEFVRLAWLEFRRYFGPGGKGEKKRQAGVRGWRQHFDNAVRKNWYKLWWFNGDSCELTTTGVAIQRESEAQQAAA